MHVFDAFLYCVAHTTLVFHWTLPPLAGAFLYTHTYSDVKVLRANAGPTAGIFTAENPNLVHLYRFGGLEKNWPNAFISAHILTSPQDLDVFQGTNLTEVKEAHASGKSLLFGLWRKVAVWRSRQLAPFQDTVIAIEPTAEVQRYLISAVVLKVDAARVFVVLLALILFFISPKLARNAAFYYTSGCGLGVCMSLAVFVFILYRLSPKKPLAYSILIGGWSIAAYIGASIWNNAKSLLLNHIYWVATYVVIVSLVSLAVCYRLGPPTDRRSHNLCQWTLQILALGTIFGVTQIEEIGLAICAFLVLFYIVPFRQMGQSLYGWWRRRYPRARRLLTVDEFEKQGKLETEKALLSLRDYCQSPECAAWKTVNKLRSPLKFAQFVEGSSHVDESEEELHERLSDIEPDMGDYAQTSVAAHKHSERYFKQATDPDISDDSDVPDAEFRSRFRQQADIDSSDEEAEFRLNYIPREFAFNGPMSTGKRAKNKQSTRRSSAHNGSLHAGQFQYKETPATISISRARKSLSSTGGGKSANMKRYQGTESRLNKIGTVPTRTVLSVPRRTVDEYPMWAYALMVTASALPLGYVNFRYFVDDWKPVHYLDNYTVYRDTDDYEMARMRPPCHYPPKWQTNMDNYWWADYQRDYARRV